MGATMTPTTWTPTVLAHTGAALSALALGGWLLQGGKGTRMHRVLGWLWVLLMAAVALLSFGIQSTGHWSWIHGLSLFTLAMLAVGVFRARTHRVQAHRLSMRGLYFGALVVTGLFTLLPHRLLGQWFWGWLR